MPLVMLSASFQSLPPLATIKLGPSGADSRVGMFVYILGPTNSPVRLGVSPAVHPPQVSTARGFEALFPLTGTLGCAVCLAPPLFLPVYLHENVRLPVHLLSPRSPRSSSHRFAMSP